MNFGHPIIGFAFVEHCRADLLREARERRLVAEARGARPAEVGVLRRQLGNALVRAGERLQGVGRRQLAGDGADSPGIPRLAR
jgi:hypothetical protein